MGRAKNGLIEDISKLPWPAGVVFGVGGFVAIRTLFREELTQIPFPPVVGLIGAVMSGKVHFDRSFPVDETIRKG